MKALVINLASEAPRMAFMAGQLTRLGIAFERVDAITPDRLSPPSDHAYWQRGERPLRTTEMAALASHRIAWERVVAEDAPLLICEDDAVLHRDAPAFLRAVEGLPEAELVSLETRGRAKLIARAPHPQAPMHRLWQDRSGAAAYVLRPAGARRLLDRAAQAPGLADGILCAAYEVTAWQAVPALAVQLDHCAALGLTPPIETESSIDREARPKAAKSAGQKLRRVRGQLRMGLRQLRRLPGAERRVVPFATD
ncbi:glycosyltransferase family 25 protein [Gymnodinialimonas ceratoperidinii]|uniref:Glycosyltransferase family 25 protein n=1 Tax=Gymnodinialimonas ceratoperidinii TaxID=2856823 RepID=A0A8F6TZ56_9RHOB|nr:glycosyltransferase family 25 protein [Gymnodinialimonas ceratoperidinii]QXT40396.1 glycosyltransferase family 25 protein [Gymnodinialimonas ceratoperidinii]